MSGGDPRDLRPLYPPEINDPAAKPAERLAALGGFVKDGGLASLPALSGEINNHIHTIYSFSPYTPAMAALKAREAGLEAAGSWITIPTPRRRKCGKPAPSSVWAALPVLNCG